MYYNKQLSGCKLYIMMPKIIELKRNSNCNSLSLAYLQHNEIHTVVHYTYLKIRWGTLTIQTTNISCVSVRIPGCSPFIQPEFDNIANLLILSYKDDAL